MLNYLFEMMVISWNFVMLMRKLLCNGGSIDYMVTARTTYGATSIPIGLGINRYLYR